MRPRFGLTWGGAGFVTREEMVAARGGAAPTHAGLLALGYPGWSDLRRHRPPAPWPPDGGLTRRGRSVPSEAWTTSDLAGAPVRRGMRAVQVLGVPAEGVAVPEADAIAVALRSRIIAPADAVTHSVAALRRLRSAGVEQYPNDPRGSPVNMTESRSQVSIGRRLASFRAGVLEVRAAFPPA